jgi:S-disulfanyl-L-cysteine oxidoreductase SoxD
MTRAWIMAGVGIGVLSSSALWLSLSPSDAAGQLPYSDPQAVARGQALYGTYCAACHGEALQGQPNWQIRNSEGKLPAPPHDATGHSWHHPDSQLIEITKYGTEKLVGGGYKSDMVGFGEVLSDDEILAVLGYIKSTWPPEIIDVHDRRNAASP